MKRLLRRIPRNKRKKFLNMANYFIWIHVNLSAFVDYQFQTSVLMSPPHLLTGKNAIAQLRSLYDSRLVKVLRLQVHQKIQHTSPRLIRAENGQQARFPGAHRPGNAAAPRKRTKSSLVKVRLLQVQQIQLLCPRLIRAEDRQQTKFAGGHRLVNIVAPRKRTKTMHTHSIVEGNIWTISLERPAKSAHDRYHLLDYLETKCRRI